MIISRTGNKQWTNRHETFTQDIDNLYDLANNSTGSELNDYNDATRGIQGIIQEATDSNKRLRVLGGEWSWSKIAATDGILLNTKPLNLSFRISKSNVSPLYARSSDDLYFSQCGVSVKELNNRLRVRKRSLKTSGASNGQTIAGAMSTGTHGSAIDIGSIPDYVVGLHIVVSPSRHVWLERERYPVVSDTFARNLNAELVRNDDFFNAAVVSFGSFGFIHGVMIETVPLFLYQCYRVRLPLDNALIALMQTLSFSTTTLALPHGNERPYHFQVVINPYDTKKEADVTLMYRRDYNEGYPRPASPVASLGPGDDAPAFIGTLGQFFPATIPLVVNTLVSRAYVPYNDVWGTHGEVFTNTDTHGRVLSAAIGVPLAEVNRVRELLLMLNSTQGPFAGLLAFRYVKETKATLGFTHFSPTCIIELDGAFSDDTHAFYKKVWDALETQHIPYTFHWGKMLELDNNRLRRMYTDHAVDAWIAARKAIMKDKDSMMAFTNEMMMQWGLDKI